MWQRLDVSQIMNSVIMRIGPVKVVAIGTVLALSVIKWVGEFNVMAFDKLVSYNKAHDNFSIRKMQLLEAVIHLCYTLFENITFIGITQMGDLKKAAKAWHWGSSLKIALSVYFYIILTREHQNFKK